MALTRDKMVSFEDYQGCLAAYFEWADSYDTKDWARLRAIVAPTLRVDYRSFLGKLWESMPAEDFVAMASDPLVLGDPTLRTQHFCGASKFERISETEIIGYHQLRVPHQRYKDASLSEVLVKGHAHSTNTHWYRKVSRRDGGDNDKNSGHREDGDNDGVWKFAGLAPVIHWYEYNFDRIFAEGKAKLSDEGTLDQNQNRSQTQGDVAAQANGIPAAV